MNITEKILAAASGRDGVKPGEVVWAEIGLAMTDDLALPLLRTFESEVRAGKVWDPEKILIVFDHMVPATTEKAANDQAEIRQFCQRYGLRFFEIGHPEHGIMTTVAHEQGLVKAGQVVVGTDSHTPILGPFGVFATGIGFTEMAVAFATGKVWFKVPPSIRVNLHGKLGCRVTAKDVILKVVGDLRTTGALYRALEFDGPGVDGISIDGRMTICCMACEVGGKSAIMAATGGALPSPSGSRDGGVVFRSDGDAEYEREYEYDLSSIVPSVAVPPNVDDVRPVSDLKGTKIDQAFIGSCINGKLEDLQAAADVLKGKRVHPRVRLVVTPVSQQVYRQALRNGWIEILIDAGAAIVSPTCGACIGGHAGLLAKGEVCASTGNRNWRGRMGSVDAEVYMMGPATAAACAVKGEICDPRDL